LQVTLIARNRRIASRHANNSIRAAWLVFHSKSRKRHGIDKWENEGLRQIEACHNLLLPWFAEVTEIIQIGRRKNKKGKPFPFFKVKLARGRSVFRATQKKKLSRSEIRTFSLSTGLSFSPGGYISDKPKTCYYSIVKI
jgi:hypothetical protein